MRKLPHVLHLPGLVLTFAWLFATGTAVAQNPRTPEQVVLADAAALSNGDLPGLLALFAEDARIYKRPTDPHQLVGALSDKMGRKDQLEAYFKPLFAKPPLPREKVIALATMGELVVALVEFADPPSYVPTTRFLTAFRVRDGQIHDLWHLAQAPATASPGEDPANVIRQLIAANNARDADRFLALFSPDAKNFRPSQDPHQLAGQPSKTLVDAASRAKFYRRIFAETPVQVTAVNLFSVGDLVVEHSHVTGFADAPDKVVNEISIYRVQDDRIVDDWFLGEETL